MIRGAWGVNPILPRAFSLVESGKGGAVLVMDVGVGTNLLCNMKVGDPLTVLGPLGNRYTGPTEGRRPILVAGGVGVAPLVFWANRLAAAGQQPIFVYGARTAGDLPLSEEIAKSARLLITTEDGSVGEKGLVTAPLTRLLADGGQYQVYSCGPDRMLEAVFGAAQAHESPCQVALESPMACGLGTCKGCAVVGADGSFKYVCSDGPVFEGATIYGGVR
jgi:dihydroorotate dehydrogenase electron transfer subunit